MAVGDKKYDVYKLCEACGEDGVLEHKHDGDGEFSDRPCHTCQGAGKVLWGEITKIE